MLVREIMTPKVITITPDTPITEIATLLFNNNLTGMPVVDKDYVVVGIVTEYDLMSPEINIHIPTYIALLRSLPTGDDPATHDFKEEAERIAQTTAQDVMTKEVITVHPNTDLDMLITLITTHRINPVPVVDDQSKLVGIVSRSDLVKLLKESFT